MCSAMLINQKSRDQSCWESRHWIGNLIAHHGRKEAPETYRDGLSLAPLVLPSFTANIKHQNDSLRIADDVKKIKKAFFGGGTTRPSHLRCAFPTPCQNQMLQASKSLIEPDNDALLSRIDSHFGMYPLEFQCGKTSL